VAKLHIQWIKSDIGYPKAQKRTLKALGFHRLNQVIEQEDSASMRGMLTKVNHLIKFEVVNNGTE
jgi:large subunit ribosomal protein L30